MVIVGEGTACSHQVDGFNIGFRRVSFWSSKLMKMSSKLYCSLSKCTTSTKMTIYVLLVVLVIIVHCALTHEC